MKNYGQDLKKKHQNYTIKLNNVTNQIHKRFELIIDNYQKFISEDDKKLIMMMGASSLSIETKIEIIINTEDNYIKKSGNQLDLFEE